MYPVARYLCWLDPVNKAIAGVDPRSAHFQTASSPSSIFLTPTAFRAVKSKKTPIILGGVCPVGMGNTRQRQGKNSHLLSKATHTPPKTTGVVTSTWLV